MAKLNPPYIEGKLPAQVGNALRIPYTLNRSQSIIDVIGTQLKAQIRAVSTNKLLLELVCDFENNNSLDYFYANFNLESDKLMVGQYYKVQLAFQEGNTVGYFSTVGVFKYTAIPEVSIENLSIETTNSNIITYIGNYRQNEQTGDQTEKVYSYRFDLYENDKIIETSGELIHNSFENDSQFSSSDSYVISKELPSMKYYGIQYTITTINGLTVSSPIYTIYENTNDLILPNLPENINLFANCNSDDGFVDVGLRLVNPTSADFSLKGKYRLKRASSLDNYSSWFDMKEFLFDAFYAADETIYLLKDFSVQQGVEYKYSISQFSEYVTTSKIVSNIVKVDFEDSFLYDGEKQLKIKFDPKVSSFKTTVLESKTDTIGGKYPHFFKNGRVEYKDFPIAGLISYNMDENNLFSVDDAYEFERSSTPSVSDEQKIKTTNLTGENIAKERDFKLKVLDWLNNGKPKLFRSPTEGNYIVRLMNISLAPNDTLGRMLHSFNATAYEIAEFNYENLILYGMTGGYQEELNSYKINQVVLNGNDILLPNATWARVIPSRMSDPYVPVKLSEGEKTIVLTYSNGDVKEVVIGSTGYYQIMIPEGETLVKVNGSFGILEYGYSRELEYPVIDQQSQKTIVKLENKEQAGQFFDFSTDIEEKTGAAIDYKDDMLFLGLKTKIEPLQKAGTNPPPIVYPVTIAYGFTSFSKVELYKRTNDQNLFDGWKRGKIGANGGYAGSSQDIDWCSNFIPVVVTPEQSNIYLYWDKKLGASLYIAEYDVNRNCTSGRQPVNSAKTKYELSDTTHFIRIYNYLTSSNMGPGVDILITYEDLGNPPLDFTPWSGKKIIVEFPEGIYGGIFDWTSGKLIKTHNSTLVTYNKFKESDIEEIFSKENSTCLKLEINSTGIESYSKNTAMCSRLKTSVLKIWELDNESEFDSFTIVPKDETKDNLYINFDNNHFPNISQTENKNEKIEIINEFLTNKSLEFLFPDNEMITDISDPNIKEFLQGESGILYDSWGNTITMQLLMSNSNIINQISDLYNISFLRIQQKDIEENYNPDGPFLKTVIYYDGTQYYEYNDILNELIPTTLNNKYYINGKEFELNSGRIEYTFSDFNEDFKLESLSLGSSLYADIYYHTSKIVLEEEK